MSADPACAPGNTPHDGREGVLTDEVLALVDAEAVRRGRAVGVLLELKSTAYFFDALGLAGGRAAAWPTCAGTAWTTPGRGPR